MERMTIGHMAKLNRVSEQTLRLYDKIGLLSPCERSEETGYRYYDIKQSARLDMIQYMKSMGFELRDIKTQLDSEDPALILQILQGKQEQVEREIRDLKCQKRAIERTKESFERYRNAPPDGTVLVEYIGERQMFCADCHINFYDFGLDIYEKILRELKEKLTENHLPQIYFCNAGSILRRDNLLARRFISTEVFVFVDNDFVPEQLITTIPGGSYLCIYCDRFEKEKEYALRLLDEARRQNLRVCGDYLCEVVAELPVLQTVERGMFLRLQVPIKFR